MATVLAVTTDIVRRHCAVAPSTLRYWVKLGLVGPSVVGPAGKRYAQYWSILDAVTAKAIKALRDVGCPMERLTVVRGLIEASLGKDRLLLYWTGDDLAVHHDEFDALVSAVQHPGQAMLVFVALPVAEWVAAIEADAEPK